MIFSAGEGDRGIAFFNTIMKKKSGTEKKSKGTRRKVHSKILRSAHYYVGTSVFDICVISGIIVLVRFQGITFEYIKHEYSLQPLLKM